jgi:hypothetical protein
LQAMCSDSNSFEQKWSKLGKRFCWKRNLNIYPCCCRELNNKKGRGRYTLQPTVEAFIKLLSMNILYQKVELKMWHLMHLRKKTWIKLYKGVGKSLARPTSRCTVFDGENISFDASLVLYI